LTVQVTIDTPFHDNLNIEARLANNDLAEDICSRDNDSGDEDPYIVEAVIDKWFHRHQNQYEFLVKWVGYSDTTWEISSNIPSNKITEYEIANNPTNAPQLSNTPYDLRRSRQSTVKKIISKHSSQDYNLILVTLTFRIGT